jgi:cell division septal protein FtsQ
VFILGLAIMAGIYWEMNTTIGEVRFTGNHFTDIQDLSATFEAPIGQHPDSVSYVHVIEAVSTLPYVMNAGIYVDARGRMIISIQERKPLGMLIDGGKRVYFDEHGVKLPVILEKSVNVPLVHGFRADSGAGFLEGREFEAVRDFLVAAKENEFGWITISEVTYNPGEGVVALSYENGVKLLFGEQSFETKLRHWEAFYSEIVRKKGIEQFDSVDLRYSNQIVTRER